ncbi:hypothetical protein BDZ91DRAFT_850601 [Kalaharituber pfeilii]|nr:hypothetical protein BDZ91DRAFT_850601 [Kalaharituber pfeilii]
MKALRPENRIAFEIIWETVVLGFILLRFWVQRHKERTAASLAADILLALSWVFVMGTEGVVIWQLLDIIKYRDAKIHDPHLHPLLQPKLHKINFALVFLYYTILWMIKGAFIAFYFDLFPRYGLNKRLRLALYGTVAFTIVTYLVNMLVHALHCNPIETAWAIGPENCNSQRYIPTLSASTFTNVINDIILMVLPLAVLRTLNLRRRDLFALSFVFLVGIITILAAIIRYIVVHQTYTNPGEANNAEKKINDIMVVMSWCLIEAFLAQIAFCLPAFRVFLRNRKGDRSAPRPIGGQNTVGSSGRKRFKDQISDDSVSQTELTNYSKIDSLEQVNDPVTYGFTSPVPVYHQNVHVGQSPTEYPPPNAIGYHRTVHVATQTQPGAIYPP